MKTKIALELRLYEEMFTALYYLTMFVRKFTA